MTEKLTLDVALMLTIIVASMSLGILIGIVLTPFMPELRKPPPTTPAPHEPTELDPAERHWVKRGPAGGR